VNGDYQMSDMYDKFERSFEPVEGSPLSGTPVKGADYRTPDAGQGVGGDYAQPSATPVTPTETTYSGSDVLQGSSYTFPQGDTSVYGSSMDGMYVPKPEPVQPAKKSVLPILAVIFGVILLVCGVLASTGSISIANEDEVNNVIMEEAAGSAVGFPVYLLSDPFYQLEDGYKLYLAFDEEYYCGIVAVQDEDFDNDFKAINEYTFSDEEEGPGTMVLTGVSQIIPSDAASYAVQYYNQLFEEDVIQDDGTSYADYFGTMFLRYDPNQVLPTSVDMGTVSALFAGAVIMLVGGFICMRRNKKRYRKMQNERVYDI